MIILCVSNHHGTVVNGEIQRIIESSKTRFLVLDFSLISGIDYSAMVLFFTRQGAKFNVATSRNLFNGSANA